MGHIAGVAEWGLLGWLAAIALLVGYRCLHGGIGLAGILAHDEHHHAQARPAPERVQLLLMFLFALVAYARLALKAAPDSHDLPEVPSELLVLFAGSHTIYLSGKLTRALHSRKRG